MTFASPTCATRLRDRASTEYRQMPGTRLTLAQAARLWHEDPAHCQEALDELVAQGFLCRLGNLYARLDVVTAGSARSTPTRH